MSTTSTWRSPLEPDPPSIGALGGIGYGPGSLSLATRNWTATLGWPAFTTTYGMPIGPPFHSPEPKSACIVALAPMVAT